MLTFAMNNETTGQKKKREREREREREKNFGDVSLIKTTHHHLLFKKKMK